MNRTQTMTLGFDSTSGPTYLPALMLGGVVRRVALVAFLFGVPSVAMAQDSGETPTAETTPATSETPPANNDDVESKRRRKDALRSEERARLRAGNIDPNDYSLQEKQTIVENAISTQRQSVERVSTLLSQATSANDVVQINCVKKKLNEVKGLLAGSEKASAKMYDAIAKNQAAKVDKQFLKISLSATTSQQSRAEAEQCVGSKSIYTGETDVEVEIDPDIPEIDPTQPTLPPPGPEFPPPATLIGPAS